MINLSYHLFPIFHVVMLIPIQKVTHAPEQAIAISDYLFEEQTLLSQNRFHIVNVLSVLAFIELLKMSQSLLVLHFSFSSFQRFWIS